MTRRGAARVGGIVVAAVLLLASSACRANAPAPAPSSSASSSGPTSSAPATPTSSPAPTDPVQLLAAAEDALAVSGTSFRVTAHLSPHGEDLMMEFAADRGGAVGTVTEHGVTVQVLRTADDVLYANAPAAWYAGHTDTRPEQAALADRWVRIPADAATSLRYVADLTRPGLLVSAVGPDPDVNTYELRGPENVDGSSAYVVTDVRGDTFVVAAGGPPLPREYTHDRRAGRAVFDRYGVPVTVAAPTDAVPYPVS